MRSLPRLSRQAGLSPRRRVCVTGKLGLRIAAINCGMPPTLLTTEEISDGLKDLEWEWEGSELIKTVELGDFAAALAWVNRVGAIAEERNHHPDIAITWNTVTLRLSTHSAGGITALDLDLARAIDALR